MAGSPTADGGNLPPEHVLSERDIHPLCEDIGLKWQDLGRELEFKEHILGAIQNEKQNVAKECCIAVLVRWLEKEGRSATAGKLAEVLNTIELKRLAERLIGSSLHGKQTLHLDIEELDERNKSKWDFAQDRNGGNKYLIRKCTKEEYCRYHEFLRSEGAVKDLEKRLDEAVKENKGCDNIETMKTSNEVYIGEPLQEIKRKLQRLTESLAIYEVNQDRLTIAVRLDLYIRLASELQELYSRAKTLTYPVAQCDTIWKEEFGESIFNGLRAAHNDLTPRVRDLESSQGDMSEKEKEEFKRLMRYMTGIESQFGMTQRFVEPRLNMPPRPLHASATEPVKGSKKAKNELAPRSNTYACPSSEGPREIVRKSTFQRMKELVRNNKSSNENISLLEVKIKHPTD